MWREGICDSSIWCGGPVGGLEGEIDEEYEEDENEAGIWNGDVCRGIFE